MLRAVAFLLLLMILLMLLGLFDVVGGYCFNAIATDFDVVDFAVCSAFSLFVAFCRCCCFYTLIELLLLRR